MRRADNLARAPTQAASSLAGFYNPDNLDIPDGKYLLPMTSSLPEVQSSGGIL